ncbi:hypothetical protein ACFL5S_01280 [Fibrobacterota bacterium]
MSCTKQVTKQTVTPEDKKPPLYHYIQGDTTQYIVSFPHKKDLRSFKRKFNNLIENYSIDTVISDTVNQYFSLRIIPAQKDTARTQRHAMTKIDKVDFVESDIEIKEEIQPEDTITPVRGGSVTLYTDRNIIDNSLSELLAVFPFPVDTTGNIIPGIDTVSNQFLAINQVSPVKIKVTCTNKLINNTGKSLTAFDVAKAWTGLVNNRPAEGLALFSEVKGIKEFIRGEEGIIRGFSVPNEKAIIITLNKPDPLVMQRLNSPKLLPQSLNIGKFYLKKQQDNKIQLMQNPKYPFEKPFLDECTIICGKDKNPIVSYSLNSYDMIILHKKKDLEYARQSMLKNSTLIPLSTDRYFLSLGPKSQAVRQYLKSVIDPSEIHSNAVKAEGEIITQLESIDQTPIVNNKKQKPKKTPIKNPLRVLYNTDDPVSIIIAEKIFSDLSHSTLPCKLKGLNKTKLEVALVSRDYDIAIGWVSNQILTNENEKLRVATIWFKNETEEAKRIFENYEIPLFTINRHALCKKDIKFFNNQFSGIYREAK